MSANKMGRPTESRKGLMLRVRIDDRTNDKLDAIVNKTKSTKSEVLRKGIEMQYDDLNKK